MLKAMKVRIDDVTLLQQNDATKEQQNRVNKKPAKKEGDTKLTKIPEEAIPTTTAMFSTSATTEKFATTAVVLNTADPFQETAELARGPGQFDDDIRARLLFDHIHFTFPLVVVDIRKEIGKEKAKREKMNEPKFNAFFVAKIFSIHSYEY